MFGFFRRAGAAVLVLGLVVVPVIGKNAMAEQHAAQPDAELQQNRLNKLFETLKNADGEIQARAVENEIWQVWMAQTTPEIQALVEKAIKKRSGYDFEGARVILDQVVTQAPEYAEGWNQRAFVLFLQEKYDDSLSDIERALELEPRHFGAMAGQAQILLGQGRFKLGQKILREAVKIHPFLKERAMIVPLPEDEPGIEL